MPTTVRNLIEYPSKEVPATIVRCFGWGHFAAYGFGADGTKGVDATLKKKDGTKVGRVIVLQHPGMTDGFWSIAFVDIPLEPAPLLLDMELLDEAGHSLGKLSDIETPPKLPGGLTQISFPLANNMPPVSSSFTAFGSTNQMGGVSAKMSGPAVQSVNAVIQSSGWFAVFRNLPQGAFTLNALEGQNIADTQKPINVGA